MLRDENETIGNFTWLEWNTWIQMRIMRVGVNLSARFFNFHENSEDCKDLKQSIIQLRSWDWNQQLDIFTTSETTKRPSSEKYASYRSPTPNHVTPPPIYSCSFTSFPNAPPPPSHTFHLPTPPPAFTNLSRVISTPWKSPSAPLSHTTSSCTELSNGPQNC